MQFNIPDGMEFSDQFLQLPVLLSSKALYGLGEHRSTLKLSTDWERFVMFNHDEVPTENVSKYYNCLIVLAEKIKNIRPFNNSKI